jgi:hypothetical protein
MSDRIASVIVTWTMAAAILSLGPNLATAQVMTPPRKMALTLDTVSWEECCAISRMDVHGLNWTLFLTQPRESADDQPIGFSAALGPIDLGLGEARGGRWPADTAAPLVTGWTNPLGLRLAIRW